MTLIQPASSRSRGQLHCKYAISLAGAAFTLALVQQLLSGAMGKRDPAEVTQADSRHGVLLDKGAVSTVAEEAGAGEPAAVIYAEDGSVVAVQQTADSTPIVVRGAVGGLNTKDRQPRASEDASPEQD